MKRFFAIVLMCSLCFGIAINCKKQTQEISPVKDKEEILEKGGKIDSDKKGKEVSEIAVDTKDDVIKKKEEAIEGISKVIPVPSGKTYYVSPGGVEGNDGSKGSPMLLVNVNEIVQPGDTVMLLDGTYQTAIDPVRSGEKGKPITYCALNKHGALFTGKKYFIREDTEQSTPIALIKRSYIIIDGIKAIDVTRFVIGNYGHHLTIQNCHFENIESPQGWENCRFRLIGDRISIINNFMKNGTDILRMYGGDNHLIQGNVFDTAGHAALALIGIQYSVIRNNTIRNPKMKLTEFQTSYGEKAKVQRSFEERPFLHNLFESNFLEHSGSYKKKGSSSPGLFFHASHTIVRRNVITDCQVGGAFSSSGHHSETLYCDHVYVYNNIFYANGRPGGFRANGPGMMFAHNSRSKGKAWGDHMFINNIFFANKLFTGAHYQGHPESIQIMFATGSKPGDASFFGNLIMHQEPGEKVFADVERGQGRGESFSLKEFESKYPQYAGSNMEADPRFVDTANGDFHLQQGSPCIDAGIALTKTSGAGRGTAVRVEDAKFFCDGFGLIEPDILRVGNEKVKAVKVDYETDMITVDRSISWIDGAPVSLDYKGEAPDIGAFEF